MSLSEIVFRPVCSVISEALLAIVSPTSSRISASRSAALSLTRSDPVFLINRSTGATGIIRSFRERGKIVLTPLDSEICPYN